MSIDRHGNRWRVRVPMGAGIRHVETLPPGARRKDAEELESRLRASRIDAAVGRKPRRTIDEALDQWTAATSQHLKSWERDRKYRISVLRRFTAGKRLEQLSEVAEHIKTQGAAAGMKAATINRYLALLRTVGNLASDSWGWTDVPIGRRVQLLPEISRRDVFLTQAQVGKLATAADPLTADMIWFAALTGLRRQEMLGLRPDQIRDGAIRLESNTKSGKPRAVPMPPRAARIAAKRLPWGVPYWQLRKRFDAARRAAGMPHVHWHDLRHTYGSWLAQQGNPAPVIRDLMGHSSLSVTDRYMHTALVHARRAVKTLPGWSRTGPGAKARKAA